MGLYDREYYRDEREAGFFGGGTRSMVTNLIIVNVVIYLIDVFTSQPGRGHWLSDLMKVQVGSLTELLQWYRFLTSGFAHDPNNIMHIGFNMLTLWFFGREVEDMCGRLEFLRFYLTAIVVGSLAWVVVAKLQGDKEYVSMLGASGAVSAVLGYFVLTFPRRTILFMMIIPMPAWVFAIIMLYGDITIAAGVNNSNIAATAHLGGFAFGLAYRWFGWNLGRLVPDMTWAKRIGRPKLKVHHPDQPAKDTRSFEAKVDAVLEKFHRAGEESLSADERRILEEASKRYQQRRR